MIQLPLVTDAMVEKLFENFDAAELVNQRIKSDLAAAQGMSQSAAHAESIEEGWTDRAYGLLARFSKAQATNPFTSEEFRLYARSVGFEIPVPKALGAVFQRAARDGLIARSGYGKSFSRHSSPCVLWRACGYHVRG